MNKHRHQRRKEAREKVRAMYSLINISMLVREVERHRKFQKGIAFRAAINELCVRVSGYKHSSKRGLVLTDRLLIKEHLLRSQKSNRALYPNHIGGTLEAMIKDGL